MKTTIKVTNEEKFNALVYDVDTSELSGINPRTNSCEGNLLITHKGCVTEEWDGEHGVNEYKDDFGFILISNEQA